MIARKIRAQSQSSVPELEQLGEFTNRVHNILAKFKAGKYPVRQLLRTLQHVGDGTLIFGGIFGSMFKGLKVQDSPPSSYSCLSELPGMKLMPGNINIMTFPLLFNYRRLAKSGGDVEVAEIECKARNEEIWTLLAEQVWSLKFPAKSGVHVYLKDHLFSPDQLRQMIVRTSADGSNEWSYTHNNYVLCDGWVDTEPVIAEVTLGKKGKAEIYLHHTFPMLTPGDRLIMKSAE